MTAQERTVNHAEAAELAAMKQDESNLARCYLALREELAAVRADAERYRWLRDHAKMRFAFTSELPFPNARNPETETIECQWFGGLAPKYHDAALDAAIERERAATQAGEGESRDSIAASQAEGGGQ